MARMQFLFFVSFVFCAIYLDHFLFGIILACQVGIICGPGAFARLQNSTKIWQPTVNRQMKPLTMQNLPFYTKRRQNLRT